MAEKIIDIVKLKKSPYGTLGNIELYSGEPIIVKNGSKYELYVGTEASANKSTSKYNLSTLVNLTDTSIVSPTYEHSLVFDATINKWVNGYPDGFKKYTTLPLVFSGTQIIYDSSVWTWSGTSYVNNSDTLDGKHASAFPLLGTLTDNYIVKWDDTNKAIVNSLISETTTSVTIGTSTNISGYIDVLSGFKLDGSDFVLNTSSPTDTERVYSAKYVDDNKMPIAFATRYYFVKANTTTAILDSKPTVSPSNYLELTSVNQYIDWVTSPKLTLTRTSGALITFNQDSIFNHRLYCSFDKDATITFGFRRFANGVQISSNDTKIVTVFKDMVVAVDIQMESDLLPGNVSYPMGTIFTDEIFISQDTPASIVSKYYCGVNVDGVDYFSWHNLTTPAASLNTNQIADLAITIPKLGQDAYNWINGKVDISTIVDTKEITGFVDGNNINVSYDDTTRQITLTGDLTYYWRGVKKSLVSPWTSSPHADTSGYWFLGTIDGTNFTWSNAVWEYSDIMVSYVRYNSGGLSYGTRETHNTMDWYSHRADHYSIKTLLVSGGLATIGTYTISPTSPLNEHNTPGFNAAVIRDEDLDSVINQWAGGSYTTVHFLLNGVPQYNIDVPFPFLSDANDYIKYNNTALGTLVNGANNKYYNVYQLLAPMTSDAKSQKFRTIMIQPQYEYAALDAALAEDTNILNLGQLLDELPEFVINARITYTTSSIYTTSGKVKIAADITYVRGSMGTQVSVGGLANNNHNSLTSLGWNSSGHHGDADTIAGFNASGLPYTKPVSDFSSSDHTHDDYLPLDGGVMSGILDMDGNVFKNAGFEEFPVLPTTFKGSQITYINKVWTWDNVNSKYIPDNATPIIPIITIDATERDKTIVHNLGYRPDIVVMDDTGEIVYVTKKHLDNNRLYLSWLGGFIGNIILK